MSVSAAGFERHRRSPGKTNFKFLAAGAVIAIAAVTIVIVAMQGSSVYYVSLAEFNAKQAALTDNGTKEVRVAGKVVPNTIQSGTGNEITFMAVDAQDKTQTMKVSYDKLPPDTFKDNSDVVVTGVYKNGMFVASEMLAKCPSKYSSQAQDAAGSTK